MKYNGRFEVALTLSLLIGLLVDVQAFVSTPRGVSCSSLPLTRGLYAKAKVEEDSFLLEEFKVANGERIHPYKILKINRSATRQEVKQAYRDLSRRYHPDGARFRDILPGNCNNLDEVRDHWERIKLAYEILSDIKMRKRFDRHEALADPGKAMQRAAFGAVGSGIKGVFKMGAFAFTELVRKKDTDTANVVAEVQDSSILETTPVDPTDTDTANVVAEVQDSSILERTPVDPTDAPAENAQTKQERDSAAASLIADFESSWADVKIPETPSSSKEPEHEQVSKAKPPAASKRPVKPSKPVGSSRKPTAASTTKTSPTRIETARSPNRRKKDKAKRIVMAEVQE
jgi:curved DNA-binding protein CbpA